MKTSLFFISILILISCYSFPVFAQDNAQIGLPEGAIARIGKGSLGEVHFSPDGSKLAVSTSIGIWIHDTKTGKELELITQKYMAYPYTFAFSPDLSKIAISVSPPKDPKFSGRNNYTIKLLNFNTSEEIAILRGHVSSIKFITFSPDGNYILSAGSRYNKLIKLWSTHSGKEITTPRKHSKWINSVVYAPDGKTFASTGDDNMVYLWDGKSGKHKYTFTDFMEGVSSLAYSPDSQYLAAASNDGTIRLLDVKTGYVTNTFKIYARNLRSLNYYPDENTIAVTTGDGDIQLWDIRSMEHKSTFSGHTKRINSITYSPDGSTIATASSDQTVRLWNVATGKPTSLLTGFMDINTAAYSPDGRTIVTANREGKVQLWDVHTVRIKPDFTSKNYGRIQRLAFSPDGNTIAVASPYYSKVFLINAHSGKHKSTLKHFGLFDYVLNIFQDREYDYTSLAYSPDGSTIVFGLDCYTHEKGMVYLWNAKSGKRKRTIFKGPGAVRTVVFSKDGNRIIATGDWQNEIRVWHAKTGKELTPTPADVPGGTKGLLHSPMALQSHTIAKMALL